MATDKEEVAKLNLEQRLAKLQEIVDVAKKNKKGFNYTYPEINEILAKLTAGMKKYRVNLHPNIVPQTAEVTQHTFVNTKFDKQGTKYDQTVTEMLVTADMTFRFVNIDNPNDCLEEPWFFAGSQSDPSQALGSGLTYAKRQFLTNYFHIALIDEDVEQYRKKQKEAEQQEDILVAEGIISEVDKLAKQYVADHPDKKDDVTKFMGKYIKGSNYLKIKEPKLAAKLLEDFKNTYMKQ